MTRHRDFDEELLQTARIKSNADESITRRISTGIQVANLSYVLAAAIIGLTIWLSGLRSDLNNEIKGREKNDQDAKERAAKDRQLLNQLYLKIYGVEVTFS